MDRVTVTGHSPFPAHLETVHIDDLVTKVLCKRHNQALSDLDQALVDLVNAIREVERLRQVRASLGGVHWVRPVRFAVDGCRVERCVLKMIMNYATVFKEPLRGWSPPEWLPDVIFGKRRLAENCGLSLLVRVGDKQISTAERVGFSFAISQRDGEPVAVLLELRKGWRFLCTWDQRAHDLGRLQLDDDIYVIGGDDLFHPVRADFGNGDATLGLSLDFDWSGKWSPAKNANVTKLRAKYRSPPRR